MQREELVAELGELLGIGWRWNSENRRGMPLIWATDEMLGLSRTVLFFGVWERGGRRSGI